MTPAAAPIRVAHAVLDPAALLHEIATHYDIGVPIDCVLLRSWINEVYRLEAARGHFIVKVFRHGWRSSEEVGYEAALMQHLQARGLAVAPPVARRDGAQVTALSAPEGARPTLLYPLLVGQPPLPPSEAVYHRVGRAIATMHQALDSFVSTHPRRALDLHYLLEDPLRWLEPHLRDRPADWAFLQTLAQRVRARLDDLERAEGLSKGPIHGDATLDNLLITGNGSIGIFDFDQSGPGWRAYELQGVFHYASLSQRPDYWKALVDGYSSMQPLRVADLAAMPCFVVLNRLWCMGFEAHVIASNHGRWIVDETYFDDRLGALRRWAAAHRELCLQ